MKQTEMKQTATKKQTARKTGYYVWVGGEKTWFRTEARAHDFCHLRQSQYGPVLVHIQDVATGEAI